MKTGRSGVGSRGCSSGSWKTITGVIYRFWWLIQLPPSAGAYPPALVLSRSIILARDLSIFVDESGDCGGKVRYHLLTLVIHDQADSISDKVARYEESLLRSRAALLRQMRMQK